ncbi:GNAT family N-acetyltransferase [Nocardioides sp. SR21]|uniref:GNAT family N-acetyltransferase n=1 Tax=Nocardioides sp. SR21 TaxID=2919501 RepID=UPI001FAB0B39|nr:GNAT family protein [Nocardioides sp. SR21]
MLPEGYEIRPLAAGDGPLMAAAYRRNREHLAPTDPDRPEGWDTDDAQAEDVGRQVADAGEGKRFSYVVVHDGSIVGRVALVNVVRGPLQSAVLSYWVDVDHQGRGLAKAMTEYAAERAGEMGLHRIEAGTLLDNHGSQAVLRRAGFTEIGVAERFLYIRGMWRDHRLFQRILHDESLEA